MAKLSDRIIKAIKKFKIYLSAIILLVIAVGMLGVAQEYGLLAPGGRYYSPASGSPGSSMAPTSTASTRPTSTPTGTPTPTPTESRTPCDDEECDKNDGWRDMSTTRWVDTEPSDSGYGPCKEKEEEYQEYYDYSCVGGECDYEIDGTRWNPTGNTQCKDDGADCEPAAAPSPSPEPVGTAEPEEEPTGTPTPSPTPSSTPEYFCKDCECKEKNCDEVFGKEGVAYEKCEKQGGSEDSPELCCKTGELCCNNEKGAEPICCNPATSTCGKLPAVLSILFGIKANICKTFACNEPGTYACTVDGNTRCCNVGEDCSYQEVGFIVTMKVPTCVKSSCDEDANEFECGNPDEGVICCDGVTEQCTSKSGLYWCLTVVCDADQTLCEGTGDAENKANKCCDPGQVCFHHPNGYPRCV